MTNKLDVTAHLRRVSEYPPLSEEIPILVRACVSSKMIGVTDDDPLAVLSAASVNLANEQRLIDVIVTVIPASVLARAAMLADELGKGGAECAA